MTLKIPNSIKECLYFTNRSFGKGKVMAWVYRKICPQCTKMTMGKPIEKGKVKTRADYYQCPSCGHKEQKKEHEESLTLEALYTCPECGKEGESVGKYKRLMHKGILSYLVICQHCQAKIPITKKLKGIGGKQDNDNK